MPRPKKSVSIAQIRRQQKFLRNRLKKLDNDLKKLSKKNKKNTGRRK